MDAGTGRLVGIVGRADVLGVYARPDKEIRHEIEDRLINHEFLFLGADRPWATVRDGVVVLRGRVERRSLVSPLIRSVQNVEGVVRVDSQLSYEVDDLAYIRARYI